MKSDKIITPLTMIFAFFLASNLYAVEYIVKLKQGVKSSKVQSSYNLVPIFNENRFLKHNRINSLGAKQLAELERYYKVELSPENVGKFAEAVPLESITPNYIYRIETEPTPNDPQFSMQWSLSYLNALRAWERATGDGIIVGVIDTGIDFEHPDLQGQLWINSKEDINGNGRFDAWLSTEERDGVSGDLDGVDDDGNGYADDVIGYDFVNVSDRNIGDDQDPDPIPYDEESHGTSVSGIIGAAHNNATGISGLAYNSKLMTIRAFDVSGAGESDDIAAAIVYAVANGVNVLNFSWGEQYASPLMHDVIKFAYANNVTMVSSSGNNNWYQQHFPSDYAEVISVGAITDKLLKSGSSNYGNRIDLLAPGQAIPCLEPNNGYKLKSGTSVAAPHVTATVAMLLELNPNLKPQELRFLLKASASDDDKYPGWDPFFGSGILDINRAIGSGTVGTVAITEPEHRAAVDLTNSDSLAIVGTVSHPLMRSYSVYVRKSINPFDEPDFRSNEPFEEWTLASERKYEQVLNDTIAMISKSLFKDSIYAVRLKIDLMNNSTYEERFYFRPYTQSIFTQNSITVPKALLVYDGALEKVIVTATTKYNANFYVEVYDVDDNHIGTYSEVLQSSLDHSVVIGGLLPGQKYTYKAFAVSATDTLKATGNLPVIEENVSTSAFQSKPYRTENLYLYNALYSEGDKSFAGTKLNGVNFVGTSLFKFQDGKFAKTDSLNEPRIVIGYGDSDGDGHREVLTAGNAELLLYEESGGKRFAKEKLRVQDKIIWPTEFVDIDNDGREDIVAHDDSSYFFLFYENGQYVEKNRIVVPAQIGRFDNLMTTIYANVDDDPEMEFVFTTSYGSLFVYEYKNGTFSKEFENLTPISTSSQHLCGVDLDGDGKKEILTLNAGYQIPFNYNSGKQLLWTAQIWDYVNGKFVMSWQKLFSGVKLGAVNLNSNGYKNGVSCGNVDGVKGDEFVISVFPDAYVFRYDGETIRPMWYYQYALSNDALIYDFDGNGRNEIGLNTFFGTQFFEITDNEFVIGAPANFDGRPLNENSAMLSWDKVPMAKSYQIYRLINPSSGQGVLFAETSSTSIVFDTLQNLTWYDFFIVSKAEDGTLSNNASNLVSCFTHPIAKPISAELVGASTIDIVYDTKMPDYELEARDFKLGSESGYYVPTSAVSSQNRHVRLHFEEEIMAGNYSLDIPEIADYYRQLSSRTIYSITSSYEGKPQELYLKSGEVDGNRLIVRFSEEVDSTALVVDNYEFSPVGKIVSIAHSPNAKELIFETDAFSQDALGFEFTLKAKPTISSVNGHTMTEGAGSVLQFTFFKQDLDKVFAYPQPVRLSRDEALTFANLSSNATIYVYDNRGELIKSITEFDGDGGSRWNLIDDSGHKLKAGVYYYAIEGSNPRANQETVSENKLKSELKKFMVVD
jgi:subtilisin family serine protease